MLKSYQIVIMLSAWLCCACAGQSPAGFDGQDSNVREGDLLFHVTVDTNQITRVTGGMIDHVAIALSADSVIEAVGRGVVVTAISDLLKQDGYFVVGRVGDADAHQSVLNARRYLGCAYDSLFLAGNDAVYCSELVQLSYVDARGRQLFTCVPMSFHDSTGRVTDYWRDFYARHQMEVPEGQPGTNPAQLSLDAEVHLTGDTLRSSGT
ncbi:MAG: hypothetical protein IJ527_02560 [Prevotella sp.]|nr:hypothetical protein [Prevotella sp.]